MNALLYTLTVLLWGTSWIAVKLHLGVVAPEVSVVYRFVGAAAVMFVLCLVLRRPMRFRLADHAFMALQGVFLFSTNYFLIYLGTQYLTSGLVAVAFSTVVAMNILGSALLFRTTVRIGVVAGALFGLAGLALVFWPELIAFDVSREGARGLVLSLLGTASASCGMLTSAWNQARRGLPVIQTNAYGMLYGAAFITLLTVLMGGEFNFDPSATYVLSLAYLTIFATVLAFWSYLTLVGRIGADRAAYSTVLFPIVALAISTWVEDFEWTALAALGIVLVLVGNALILKKPRHAVPSPAPAAPGPDAG